MDYLGRKRLKNVQSEAVRGVLENPSSRILVAPSQEEFRLGWDASVIVAEDEMSAYLTLIPPEDGGEPPSLPGVAQLLADKGIVYGVDEQALRRCVENREYGMEIPAARGIFPVDGTDGKLVFHFSTDFTGAPVILKDGRVDYRTMDLFEQVKAEQVLVTRERAAEGSPGYTVRGRLLKQKPGKEARMPAGKNVELDEERLVMTAKISGRVDFVNHTVTVSDRFFVKGDADLTVGNIDFDGDVVIGGNVISELTIKATRNIEVNGVVEGAKLVAGGSILLKSGMQGNDKGSVEAGGDLTAKYIERTTVRAGGNIVADAILHCRLSSGGSITVRGKYGCIIGGAARAQNSIQAKSIGSSAGLKTGIEVGIALEKRERLSFLTNEVKRLREEQDKFEKILSYLGKMESLPPEKEALKRTVFVGMLQDKQKISEYTAEMEKTEEEIRSAVKGKVHVMDTVYPGVRIAISLGEYKVTSPIRFATFRFSGKEVSFSACELE
ncbi:DUF342 domain-containing protein [Papillibacter cinnamivorans]|uniref:DUF342 domain-containing protein n=1 Tax=Papillibacter cinnamivorans TaxID=100176 RepID=UPI0013566AC1|nr:FapA family protein [Papillibacter cinnamivorans]